MIPSMVISTANCRAEKPLAKSVQYAVQAEISVISSLPFSSAKTSLPSLLSIDSANDLGTKYLFNMISPFLSPYIQLMLFLDSQFFLVG